MFKYDQNEVYFIKLLQCNKGNFIVLYCTMRENIKCNRFHQNWIKNISVLKDTQAKTSKSIFVT